MCKITEDYLDKSICQLAGSLIDTVSTSTPKSMTQTRVSELA